MPPMALAPELQMIRRPHDISRVGRISSEGSTSPREHQQSALKKALKAIPVPSELLEGIDVVRVYANGKTKRSYITLSEDKFTLYITSEKFKKRQQNRTNSIFPWRNKNGGSTTPPPKKQSGNFAGLQQQERAIDIGAIHSIQRGHATRKFELARKYRQNSAKSLLSENSQHSGGNNKYEAADEVVLRPERCFSLIFRGDWTLDLMLDSESSVRREDILNSLDRIIHAYQEQKNKVSNDVLLLRYVWLEADRDGTNTINASEIGRVLQRINYCIMRKGQLNDSYEKFGKKIGLDRRVRRQGLTFEQCCTFLHMIKRDTWQAKPVDQVWNSLFGGLMKNGKQRETVSDKTFLEKFMHVKQGETSATIADVRRLFLRLNQLELPRVAGDSEPKDPTRIDKNRFEAYLMSAENDAFNPSRERYKERLMNQSISEYWINTSHNTYLTGDQFTSSSKVEMYSNALYRGCRCLELDIWDGDLNPDDGLPTPVVWHGHTMTTKILFKDIIKTIKLFLNFHPDTFPIILSFENHCSLPYQEVMADQLVRILGEKLYVPTEASLHGRLPSPMDLRGMVVIKGRRPDVGSLDVGDDTDEDSDDEMGASSSHVQSSAHTGDTKATPSTNQTQSSVRHGISPLLARLTLFHGTKLNDWDDSVRNPTHHMHSFSESRVRTMCRKNMGRKWAIYNQAHMTRTYPAGSRVDSSNYIPILPWSVGCQMVALNFQTADNALRLNDGRFRENGGCGYVLKPSALLNQFDQSRDSKKPTKVSVRVLSGSCLPKPKEHRPGQCINPFVKVSFFDVKNGDKEISATFSTKTVEKNGFCPIWNLEDFSFMVENWAVAMLQLTVYDRDATKDTFVATASIPVSCLRRGLRSVKLFDATNTQSGAIDFASLLIDVDMEDKALVEI